MRGREVTSPPHQSVIDSAKWGTSVTYAIGHSAAVTLSSSQLETSSPSAASAAGTDTGDHIEETRGPERASAAHKVGGMGRCHAGVVDQPQCIRSRRTAHHCWPAAWTPIDQQPTYAPQSSSLCSRYQIRAGISRPRRLRPGRVAAAKSGLKYARETVFQISADGRSSQS